ncbi:DNA polymerase II large subunit [Clarias magur]|uniref:DNA polymerase II large subunit n=1 Tax=Clarias magur TaxID=1594786 RepID=A0A8J4UFX1_CLAMG|nr:DNA polymerase II large subunit [Clarias magur]
MVTKAKDFLRQSGFSHTLSRDQTRERLSSLHSSHMVRAAVSDCGPACLTLGMDN